MMQSKNPVNDMVQKYPLCLGNEKPLFVLKMHGTGDGFHPVPVEHHYRLQYYEALDSTIAEIKNRFNQSIQCRITNFLHCAGHIMCRKFASQCCKQNSL